MANIANIANIANPSRSSSASLPPWGREMPDAAGVGEGEGAA